MPDWLVGALAQPGLGWLLGILLIAGMVRGFAGFGGALVFVPLASVHLSPIWVIVALMPSELLGTLPLIPRARRDGTVVDVLALSLGALICLPLGTLALRAVDPLIFRWVVGVMALTLVAWLASGQRHGRVFRPRELVAIGGASGFMGGFSGLAGPPVVLAYVSGPYDPSRVRANALMFFLLLEIMMLCTFHLQGVLDPGALAVGVVVLPAYILGNLIGARIFNPAHARLYRWVAYGIITASAIVALPIAV